VHGDRDAAADLAKVVQLIEYHSKTQIIKEDASDNMLLLLLFGEVSIEIKGQEIARRQAGMHVGEMAMLDPGVRRSASVIAREDVVAAAISERAFCEVANRHPNLWRRIAIELSNRLRQRSRLIRPRNATPILFVGSSRESLPVVTAIQNGLAGKPVIARPWTTSGVFSPSEFPIDDLAKQVLECDFAALVIGPDDRILSRGVESEGPRDNVLLELGLFMGALGRNRTFLVVPRDIDVKIPSDVLGLNPVKVSLSSGSLADNVIPACGELWGAIEKLGSR
jgi:CRP/FNR family transcriptional regulator, cyclic AMP receptor protein